jgi:hypothetical protein
MRKLLFILGLSLFTSMVNAQVINWVEHEWQADITVQIVRYEWEADVTICKTKNKNRTTKPGVWWWDEDGELGRDYSSNRLNVCRVKYGWQADYKVYLTTYEYKVKVTNDYLNEIK